MTSHWEYRRWDGTQRGFEDEVDALFSELTDDLLYHGDPDAALRRLLTSGFRGADGERVQGLRELMERLRQQRQEELDRGDLGGAFEEIARELEEVVSQERGGLESLKSEAAASDDERRRQVTDEVVAERTMELELLPNDLAGRVRGLQQYDFVSSEAREHFEQLLDKLRQEITKSWFDQMSEAMTNPDPAQLERVRQMLDALNRMIEQRDRGEPLDPSFESFMEDYGEFFPGNPQTLDELLEQFAAQMAAVQAALDSMSPEQRAQLQALADSLFEDLDMRWQIDRLSENLRRAVPDAGWGRRYRFTGSDPMGLADAASAARRLGEMDQLEQFLRSATSPRRIGQRALSDLFSKLAKDRLGGHRNTYIGTGHEPEGQTKRYEFGDPFTLDIQRTVHNAVTRSGAGTPVRLEPDDFEIARTEHLTRASTVLMVDLSLSMPMRDNFLAAKKVAMALHTLISTRFPRDFLGLVGFSEVAREIKPQELPEVSWDYVYGTNMQHGLILARRMLAHRPGTKQIIMITDGEPTAHIVPDGRDGAGDPGRGASLHACRHHHQHLHARRQPLAAGLRRADDEAQPGP
ncbi:MAG: VWA domain-containing protein, partial [Acidimicrobiales bacterium]